MSLFVIGSSNTDLVIYLDHIPKIGETIIGGESKVVFGGKLGLSSLIFFFIPSATAMVFASDC